VLDEQDDTIRITGPGHTELVVGLTEDRTKMFFGMQGYDGQIGCACAVKKDAKKIVDRMADMHFTMKGPP
jgi:hypothetical protein